MLTKLVIGTGYLGARVAIRWRQEGARVHVTTRDAARAHALALAGCEVHEVDVTRPASLATLPTADIVLYSVAYDPQGNAPRESVVIGGLRSLLDGIPEIRDRFIYISTTGVYGQHENQWVDERSPNEPLRAGGHCHLAAEQLLQAHRWGARSVILRLAGIYGPGRIPYLDRLRAGKPLPVDPAGYMNLIHVDDAVEVIVASERTTLPNLFVVSDGVPVARGEYYHEVARRVGCPLTFCDPDPSSHQAQRARGSKRVRVDKLRAEMDVRLEYPSYREGLASILRETCG